MCGFLTKVSSKLKSTKQTAVEHKAARKYLAEMLLEERCYGLPGTNGSFCSNFVKWTANKHQILSLFFAYKEHPFGRCERFIIFLTTMMIGLFVSVVLLMNNRCDEATDFNGHGLRRLDSVPGSDTACNDAQFTPWEQSLIVAAVLTPIDSILKSLATCKCMQNTFVVFRRLVKLVGSLTVCITCSIGVIFALIGITLTFNNLDKPQSVLFSWFVGEAQSQLLWFGFYPFVFCCLYNRHRKRFQEDNPGFVAIDERVRSARANSEFINKEAAGPDAV